MKRGRAFISTVPTGASHPPYFAQILTSAICESVRTASITTDCWIDNVRILGQNEAEVRLALEKLKENCTGLGIHFNKEETDPRQYNYLGIAFDHAKQTVNITEKARKKLLVAASVLERDEATVDEYTSLFARCVWCSSILAIDRAQWYYVYKFARRRLSGEQDHRRQIKVWPSIKALWKKWTDIILSAAPRRIDDTNPISHTIYTDASLSGFGGVIFGRGDEPDIVIAGTWGKCSDHINVLEMRAVREVLARWENAGPATVKLYVDNTSVLGQLRRGAARNFKANEELVRIRRIASRKNIEIVEIAYVLSLENPADSPSRANRTFTTSVGEAGGRGQATPGPRCQDNPVRK